MPGTERRLALLADGCFTPLDAKTAVGVLRYRPERVAAVLDRQSAGRTANDCVGVGGATPVVASIPEAASLGARALLIGVAPQGGELPAAMRPMVREALELGWDVLAGLHVFLSEDPEFISIAGRTGARLVDARRPPPHRPIAARRAAGVEACVVLTVGSDCNVGKMTTALEVVAALRGAGRRAAFVATGQTGMFVADQGVAVDAVPADFVAGAVEQLVLEAARNADFVVVEGQGSLLHPAYSGVTLGLLHGACPRAMILCHETGRGQIRQTAAAGRPGAPPAIPPLQDVVRHYEEAAAWVHPARVVGVALNTRAETPAAARDACTRAAAETGLPVVDPIRDGAGSLAAAVTAVAGGAHATLD